MGIVHTRTFRARSTTACQPREPNSQRMHFKLGAIVALVSAVRDSVDGEHSVSFPALKVGLVVIF